jgi:hypothetical protein
VAGDQIITGLVIATGAITFAFLIGRVWVRIVAPELAQKLREQSGDDWANSEWPAVPDDFHDAATNGTEAQHHA